MQHVLCRLQVEPILLPDLCSQVDCFGRNLFRTLHRYKLFVVPSECGYMCWMRFSDSSVSRGNLLPPEQHSYRVRYESFNCYICSMCFEWLHVLQKQLPNL